MGSATPGSDLSSPGQQHTRFTSDTPVGSPHPIYSRFPVTKGSRRIRVLTLEPGIGDDVLRGKLFKESLDNDEVYYTALSYSWSGSIGECMMYVNGLPFNVTAILDSALRHFRDPTVPKNIWVDAICINQSDNVEKSHQVALMADIYRNANLTWIWLGEGSSHSEIAMDFIATFQPDIGNREGSKIHQIAMADFMQRRWWSRIWVVQEALLSRRPVFHYGNKTLELAPLLQYMSTGKDQVSRPTGHPKVLPITPRQPFVGFLLGWHDYKEQIENDVLPLHRLLYLTRDFKASIWRDRIFALLGLTTAHARSWIAPDYSDHTTDIQILTRLTTYFLQFSLESLRLALRYRVEEGPSWVADWTCIDQATVQNLDRHAQGLNSDRHHLLEDVLKEGPRSKDAKEAGEILHWIQNFNEAKGHKPRFNPPLSESPRYDVPSALLLTGYVLRRNANGNATLWPLQGSSLYTLRNENKAHWTLISRRENWSMGEYRRIYEMGSDEALQPETFQVR